MADSNGELTQQARSIVRELLNQGDFAGRDALLAQVDGIEYVGGPVTMMDLRVSRTHPPSTGVPSPVPNGPNVVDDEGEVIGMLLLWLDDHGYIDCLEYGWVTDEMPTELPRPKAIVSSR
jgi:hypothetical protein